MFDRVRRTRLERLIIAAETGIRLATGWHLYADWNDLWVGVYRDQSRERLYICPLPCVVIRRDGLAIWHAREAEKRKAGQACER
jgi:hypothetical protein